MAAVAAVPSSPARTSSACTAVIEISGMTCASCVLTLEKAISSINGVDSVAVSLPSEQAEVHYDAVIVDTADIIRRVDAVGFDARLKSDTPDVVEHDAKDNKDFPTAIFEILGMTCASCVRTIEKAIGSLDGIRSVTVSLPMEQAEIVYDPALIGSAEVIFAVDSTGFDISLKPQSEGINIMTLDISCMPSAFAATQFGTTAT
jgi:Cu+-exporting ATPase